MQQTSDTLDLDQALGILRRRAPWIALCLALVAAASYGFSKQETKQYTATASLAFSNGSLIQQVAGLAPSSSGNASLAAQQDANLELARAGNLATKTARLLGHGLTAESVANSLSINTAGESSEVDVAATATSPRLAAAIANTYARQVVTEQQSANGQSLSSALTIVNGQLAALPPGERFAGVGATLQARAQTLELLLGLKYGTVQVAQEAAVPARASSPDTSRNTLLGAVLGLLVGLGLAFLLEHYQRRVRGAEDLEAIYRLPTLGGVPKSRALSRWRPTSGQRKVLGPAETEAFSLIRGHLRLLNGGHDIGTLLVVSPSAGDGKSTIAANLATVAARLGSHVLLLEGDLRHPTLAQQMGIRRGPGLADALIGAISMADAVQAIGVEAVGAVGERSLHVLTAGGYSPPHPGELLESVEMVKLLARARAAYDLVVIDTPALTDVSDAFSLLTEVDGVVVVGWVGRSRRHAAERLHRVLASSGAPVTGVIANGSRSEDYRATIPAGTRIASVGVPSTNGNAGQSDEPEPAITP